VDAWAERRREIAMRTDTVGFLLYVKDRIGDDALATLEERLVAHSGVTAVRYQPTRPNLLLIDYDPRRTTSNAVLTHAIQQNVEARLIGL
jgi:hypothetical protein